MESWDTLGMTTYWNHLEVKLRLTSLCQKMVISPLDFLQSNLTSLFQVKSLHGSANNNKCQSNTMMFYKSHMDSPEYTNVKKRKANIMPNVPFA